MQKGIDNPSFGCYNVGVCILFTSGRKRGMIFGKYINKYYLKYAWILLVGLAALVLVDYFQLEVPELYRMVVNGINTGVVETAEGTVPFDLNFLLDKICLPLIIIIL